MLVCAPVSERPCYPAPSGSDPDGAGSPCGLTLRIATMADAAAITGLIEHSIDGLLTGVLTPVQVERSRSFMALDTQLIQDHTYFVATELSGRIAGCGGWSFRATVYGGDCTQGRDARRLDPDREPARIRAMYTHPAFVRRGIGRMILTASEKAAVEAGFQKAVLGATIGGEPLYRACGYREISRSLDGGVPIITMGKDLSCPQ